MKNTFGLVQRLLDVDSEDTIRLHLGFDAQWQDEFDDRVQHFLVYYSLFHTRWFECLTGKKTVAWDDFHLPLKPDDKDFRAFLLHLNPRSPLNSPYESFLLAYGCTLTMDVSRSLMNEVFNVACQKASKKSTDAAAGTPLTLPSVPRRHEPTIVGAGVKYVGDAVTKTYHNPNCDLAQQISPRNYASFYATEEAMAEGYIPCQTCAPQ